MIWLIRKFCLGLLKAYQVLISPVLYMVGVRCRHEPTCSHYAMKAFRIHPLGRAFALTAGRLLRCHPWGTHGIDPVPPVDGHSCEEHS